MKNVKKSTPVIPGQLRWDPDPRSSGRVVRVEKIGVPTKDGVNESKAIVEGFPSIFAALNGRGRRTRIAIKRLEKWPLAGEQ